MHFMVHRSYHKRLFNFLINTWFLVRFSITWHSHRNIHYTTFQWHNKLREKTCLVASQVGGSLTLITPCWSAGILFASSQKAWSPLRRFWSFGTTFWGSSDLGQCFAFLSNFWAKCKFRENIKPERVKDFTETIHLCEFLQSVKTGLSSKRV